MANQNQKTPLTNTDDLQVVPEDEQLSDDPISLMSYKDQLIQQKYDITLEMSPFWQKLNYIKKELDRVENKLKQLDKTYWANKGK